MMEFVIFCGLQGLLVVLVAVLMWMHGAEWGMRYARRLAASRRVEDLLAEFNASEKNKS